MTALLILLLVIFLFILISISNKTSEQRRLLESLFEELKRLNGQVNDLDNR
jgi:hypothetical protein